MPCLQRIDSGLEEELAVWNRGGSVPGRHEVECIVVGPFPVQGEQIQRGVGAYAFHQIHSRQRAEAQERSLQCCTVCARTCWLEDMSRLKLFVEAKVGAVEEEEAADSEEEEQAKRKEGWKTSSVEAAQVQHIHENILDARRYQMMWPLIPPQELFASCVRHPSGKYVDGTAWLWVLNRKVIPEAVDSETLCWVCKNCTQSLTRKRPTMPKFALANSLWVGRYPSVFKRGGGPLSSMTFLLLSLGRPVVQKVIAEKHKGGPLKEKQKGMRANTIAFPQARLHELQTAHLPPTRTEAERFLADTISIALVGCDPEA